MCLSHFLAIVGASRSGDSFMQSRSLCSDRFASALRVSTTVIFCDTLSTAKGKLAGKIEQVTKNLPGSPKERERLDFYQS